MKTEIQQIGTVEILTPSVALVDDDAREFCELLQQHVNVQSPRIVVSMQEVPYMDSVAIEGLLDSAEHLARRALALRLVAVPATCREILDLVGIAGHFRFFEDAQDAVRSFM